MKKDRLRSLSREYTEKVIIEVAQNMPVKDNQMSEEQKKEVKLLYVEIFELKKVEDLRDKSLQDFIDVLKPERLLEKFAYRKRDRGP